MSKVKPLYPKINSGFPKLAMYIDEHMYSGETSEEIDNTMFIYMYNIINMLAHKGKFFKNAEYYEDFSVFMASSIFMRMKNPKQDTGELPKIKSVLNYIKKTIYPCKVNFEKEFYAQTVIPITEENFSFSDTYSLADKIAKNTSALNSIDFKMYLDDIVITVREFLKRIPYNSVKTEWNNIYTSCLLSLLNSVTLSKENIRRVYNNIDKDEVINKIYAEERRKSTILYHLDENMRDYITILTTELQHIIAQDLAKSLHKTVLPEDNIKDMILSEINNLSKNEVDE